MLSMYLQLAASTHRLTENACSLASKVIVQVSHLHSTCCEFTTSCISMQSACCMQSAMHSNSRPTSDRLHLFVQHAWLGDAHMILMPPDRQAAGVQTSLTQCCTCSQHTDHIRLRRPCSSLQGLCMLQATCHNMALHSTAQHCTEGGA